MVDPHEWVLCEDACSYGGIDMQSGHTRMAFGLPCQWRDGAYDPSSDLLNEVPGDTPEERRAHILGSAGPPPRFFSVVSSVFEILHCRFGGAEPSRNRALHVSRVLHFFVRVNRTRRNGWPTAQRAYFMSMI